MPINLTDVFNSASVAARFTEAAANKIPYLGAGLFPAKKKMGLDLKQIRAHKKLPVSLAPSNFDAKSTLRTREPLKVGETEMAFFRESILVKEKDEQEILRIEDVNDPYAREILARIFDDAGALLAGAEVIPERMRMQLLCPQENGSPNILISANGVQYAYDYDPDGSYAAHNYKAMSDSQDMWTDHENSTPLSDIQSAMDANVANSGAESRFILMNSITLNHLKANKEVRGAVLAQNVTANVFMNTNRIKEMLKSEFNLDLLVYNGQYMDNAGAAHKFYADGYVSLLPEGTLGNTWYGTTPEERTLLGKSGKDVTIVNTGVAIKVAVLDNPVNTETTVSEIVLPSFERMDETYAMKVF